MNFDASLSFKGNRCNGVRCCVCNDVLRGSSSSKLWAEGVRDCVVLPAECENVFLHQFCNDVEGRLLGQRRRVDGNLERLDPLDACCLGQSEPFL